MTPIRCSDDAGFAGRLGGGLTASGARPLLGLGAGFAGLAFFRDAGRSGAFLATFFRIVLALLTVFLRVPLLTGIFLRLALALPFAFFLFAIAASLTLKAFRLWVAPHYPPKALKEKEKKMARRLARDIKRKESPSNIRRALGNFYVTRDRFVAGGERNGPLTRGLPARFSIEKWFVSVA